MSLRTAIASARFSVGRYREALRASRRLAGDADATDGSPRGAGRPCLFVPFRRDVGGPVQVREEIEELVRRIEALPARRNLQIGTANGGTLFLLARAGVGPSHDRQPRHRGLRCFPPLLLSLVRAARRQRVIPLRADSHLEETVAQRVRELCVGQPLDLLFIDGDHAYDSVRRDFELYAPLVRPDGLIAFHDIVPGDEELVGGVPRVLAGAAGLGDRLRRDRRGLGPGRLGDRVVRPEALAGDAQAVRRRSSQRPIDWRAPRARPVVRDRGVRTSGARASLERCASRRRSPHEVTGRQLRRSTLGPGTLGSPTTPLRRDLLRSRCPRGDERVGVVGPRCGIRTA